MIDEMVDSGVEWIGEIPKGWGTTRLKDWIQSKSGSGKIKNTCNTLDDELSGMYPAFSASGQDVWVCNPTFTRPGIVLSAVGARCGKTFLALHDKWDAIANTQSFFPKKSNIHLGFLWYLTNNENFWFKGGTAQPFVQTAKTLEQIFSLPPLAEQKAIADFLDRETSLIDRRLSLIDKKRGLLKELRKSVVHEAVTKGLNKDAEMVDSGVEWIGEIPKGWGTTRLKDWIQSKSGSGKIKNTCNTLDDELSGMYPAFSASGQDVWVCNPTFTRPGIVLSAVGARCGKTFLALHDKWDAIANTQSFFPKKSNIHLGFLWYLTNNENFWFKGGTAQPFVQTAKTLEQIFPLPPLAEQKAIAEFLDRETSRIDKMLSIIDKQDALLKEQRKALVHEVVTGKRRVI